LVFMDSVKLNIMGTLSRVSEATTEAENQVEGRFLLNVVVGESTAVFELLSSKDEALLIWGNTFLILDLSLDVLNGV